MQEKDAVLEEQRTMEELGEPLCSGRSSDIYEWKKGVLLKLFHEDMAPELIDRECVNSKEAYEKGVAKAYCYGKVQVGERSGILMERIEGKTMIEMLGKKPAIVFQASKIMARLQIQLHHTHTDKIRSYKDMVLDALEAAPLRFLTEEERKRAAERIGALADGDAILHLDYHPDNIMTAGEDYTVIDWMTAARGTPAADVAATLFLLNECEMIPGLSPAVAAVLEFLRKKICNKYYKIYKAETGLNDREVEQWRLPFMIVRLGIWNVASEVEMLQGKIREELKKNG